MTQGAGQGPQPAVPWLCPLCRAPLARSESSLGCAQGHCFDLAREGYVNLLPVNRKRSRAPGDSREMIEARRRVHTAELYAPLVSALVAQLSARCSARAAILDLGCGEGYYSKGIAAALGPVSLRGIDIAKPAVRLAAKACPAGHFAVASAVDVPLPDASLDAVVCVFAPAHEAELARLLKPGGWFIQVTPGENHLWELRQQLYDAPRKHAPAKALSGNFSNVESAHVRFELALRDGQLQDLLAMTPYAYGGQRENKDLLAERGVLATQADFRLAVYRRGR